MNSYTHKYMTKTALNMIFSISNESIYKNDVDNFVDIVEEFSTKPDIDENDGMYTTHFYNPATGLNYNGKKMTALEKMKIHLGKAEVSEDKEKKMEEIGRAIHFIQDICTPVHTYYEDTFDAVYRLHQHTKFEEMCDKMCENELFDKAKIKVPKLLKENSMINIAKYFAGYSSILFAELDNEKFFKEIVNFNDYQVWGICGYDTYWNTCSKDEKENLLNSAIGGQAVSNGIIATYILLDKFEMGYK